MSRIGRTVRRVAIEALDTVSALAHPRLDQLYGDAAKQDASTRNPLIVIPGVMGARLEHPAWNRVLWGAETKSEYADPTVDEDLRAICHPMGEGVPLREMATPLVPSGTIDRLRVNMAGLPLHVKAYDSILSVLGVGGYLMEASGNGAARSARRNLEYGASSISTCYQFDYDWRLSIPQNAARFAEFVDRVCAFAAFDSSCPSQDEIKVDVVAHSMGGLLLRYFLRYGDQLLPEDGSLPVLNWSGARRVEHALLVGPPNAGSLVMVQRILNGLPGSPAMPAYDPLLIGTMPSMYQLLPRPRHGPLIDRAGGEEVDDLMHVDRWMRMRWGLADPAKDDLLKMLLPEASSAADRRRIALDHLQKCLIEAEQFHRALDLPADTPSSVAMHLFAGDGAKTPAQASVSDGKQRYRVERDAYGDGVVLRSSALMDERVGGAWSPRVLTPIRWDAVTFIPTGHMGLTRHPTFINNALYILLEKPRPTCNYRLHAPSGKPPPSGSEEAALAADSDNGG